MASPTDQYGFNNFNGLEPFYGSRGRAPSSPTDVYEVIDGHLHKAMDRIKLAHQELVNHRRSVAGPGRQPFVGVADHICTLSNTLFELTSALTQESMKKEASAFVSSQTRAHNAYGDPSAYVQVQSDSIQLEHIHGLTQHYDRSVRGIDGQSQSHLGHLLGNSSPNTKTSRRPLPGPASPISVQSSNSVASPTAVLASPDGRNKLPNQAQSLISREGSPPGLSDKDHFANYNLDRWKRRGKGAQNYCPRGLACNKGGVKDGQLVHFERNSAFIQHCNKHKRPFVCELPGCPNPIQRRSFARADGLRRHQDSVSHGVPCENKNMSRQRTERLSTGSQEPRGMGPRSYLKPENDFSDPGSGDSEMEDAPTMKIDTS